LILEKTKLTKEIVKERYKVFNNAKDKLKKDFYGIDSVIDKIFESIETWYIYPEYMTRPCIINLWGLTGVGKTDLVKKLKTYLKIESFATTEMDNTSSTIEDMTCDTYIDRKSKSIFDLLNQYEITPDKHSILMLDEIHRYRTLDIEGKPVHRNRYNDIWRLLSDGALYDSNLGLYKINEAIDDIESKYDAIRMNSSKTTESFEEKLSFMLGSVSVDEKELEKEKKEKMELIKKNGFVPYEYRKENQALTDYDNFTRGTNNCVRLQNLLYVIHIDDEDMQKLKLLKFLYQGRDDYIINEIFMSTSNKTNDDFDSYYKYFANCSNKVLLEWLKYKKKKIVDSHNKLNDIEIREENMKYIYSNMLIFICGNIDKDLYSDNKEIDIRKEMSKLFRAEQVSRFGNTYITYPVLDKEVYEKVILNEIKFTENRLSKEYEHEFKFDIDDIKNKVYEELPKDYIYNGVRPVYSAVQRVLSNIIPKMLIENLK